MKFIYSSDIASLCDMVGMCAGMSSATVHLVRHLPFPSCNCSALGPSENALLMCTHSSKYAFLNVSPTGIQYCSIGNTDESFDPLCGLSLTSCYQVLGWHHCRQVFSSCSATQSRPLPFFPSWMYLLGGEDNCMLSVPSSTCGSHKGCWQGGDICQAKDIAAFTLFSYELR